MTSVPAQPTLRVHLETFGCQMNELDSELVGGRLGGLGYRLVAGPDEADVVLYNTCSVRDLAEQKVRSRLGQLAKRRERDAGLVVGVIGCMAERDGVSLLRQFPVVDLLCGPAELDKLPGLLANAIATRRSLDGEAGVAADLGETAGLGTVALAGDRSRRSSTLGAAEDSLELLDLSRSTDPSGMGSRSAYVRITRGCNKFCTYCVVPHTRGAEIHRPPDHIVEECRKLAESGVIEVTLLGQTVNHYRFEHGSAVLINGVTQPQKGRTYKGSHHRDAYGVNAGARVTTFADLLHRIHEEVPAIERLRFVTSYPRDFGVDVLEVIRDSPRICRYLHCPAQSGSDDVLKRMNRGYTAGEFEEWAARAREYLHQPEIGRPLMIAGDIIVGFCGETDADYELTRGLLERVRFKNNFIFKYSPRPGTTAFGRLPDDVPDEVKRWRCNDLLALQSRISEEVGAEQIGQTVSVFVEGLSARERKKASKPIGAVGLTVGGRTIEAPARDMDVAQAVAAPQLSGRTDGDLIVVFDCPPGCAPDDLVGTIHRVHIGSSRQLTLQGDLVGASNVYSSASDTER
ncbi:MAG: radical SAM protein [Planctomycetota bacterium]